MTDAAASNAMEDNMQEYSMRGFGDISVASGRTSSEYSIKSFAEYAAVILLLHSPSLIPYTRVVTSQSKVPQRPDKIGPPAATKKHMAFPI
jgi:hypothetical protein